MENAIIAIMNVIFLLLGIYKIKKVKNVEKLIINDEFWLYISWEICLLLYSFSGIVYPISLKLGTYCYIVLFWSVYLIGGKIANHVNSKNNIIVKEKSPTIEDDKRINFLPLFFISLFSTIMYVLVICFENPNIKIGITRGVNTNAVSTFFLIFNCSSLIIWLYELLYSIKNKKRIKVYGIISAVLYNIPGVVISGRDALMIFVISSFIIIVYGLLYLRQNNLLTIKFKKQVKNIASISIGAIFAYLLLISSIRYGTKDSSVLNMFEWASGAKFPKYLIIIYRNTGAIGKFILNIVFYYTSQFSKLALMFDNYKGPYQFGLHQLHYVARILPSFLGVNANAVSNEVEVISNNYNLPGIRNLWGTVIEYSIFDFGRIGALIYSFVSGFIIKILVIKNSSKSNNLNIISLVLICVGMFTTVEISPIFDYFYIFPIIWLILIKYYPIIKKRINFGDEYE